MIPRPLARRWAPPILAAAFLAVAGRAAAQDPKAGALDNAMVKIGPVGINPSVNVRNVGRDDNVFDEATDPKQDFTATISPKADVFFEPGRFKLTYTETTDYVYYEHYTSERGINEGSSVTAEVDMGWLHPFVSTTGVNTKDRYNTEVDARARHRDRGYAAGLSFHLFTRTTATAEVKTTRTRFDDGTTFRGQSLSRSFDSNDDIAEATVAVDLTPLTSIGVAVDEERQRFLLATERDGDSLRIAPRINFSPLGLLNGSASIGYRHFIPKAAFTPDFSGWVASVSIGVTLFDRQRLTGSLVRDLTFSYDESQPYFLGTNASLAWDCVFGRADVQLNVTRNLMTYKGSTAAPIDANDTYGLYGASLGYKLRKNIRAAINGERVQRNSHIAIDPGFHNSRIYASLSWGGGA